MYAQASHMEILLYDWITLLKYSCVSLFFVSPLGFTDPLIEDFEQGKRSHEEEAPTKLDTVSLNSIIEQLSGTLKRAILSGLDGKPAHQRN